MAKERAELTNNALKIDGTFLEDSIPGYTTLDSVGREALPREYSALSIATSDGEFIRSRRYLPRDITIQYLIRGKDTSDVREKIIRLNNLLSTYDAAFSFNDEAGRFFIGEAVMDAEVTMGKNYANGSFTIHCADPFKYSVEEFIAKPEESTPDTIIIDYGGTHEARPILEAEFPMLDGEEGEATGGDCGYVAFTDENENIIQLGNPYEVDGTVLPESQTLANRAFKTTEGWTVGGGAIYGSGTILGSLTCGTVKDEIWGKTWNEVHPAAYGSNSGWHGPSLHIAPQDTNHEQAVDFELSWQHKLNITANDQLGNFQALLLDASSNVVAGVQIIKSATGGSGKCNYIVDGKMAGSVSIDLSQYNTHFGCRKKTPKYKKVKQKQYYNKKTKKWQTKKIKGAKTRKVTVKQVSGYEYTTPNLNASIKKMGGKVVFTIGNLKAKTHVSSTRTEVATLLFFFGKWKTSNVIALNRLISAKLVKLNADRNYDIKNSFTAGDVVIADCNSAEVYLRHTEPEVIDPDIAEGDVIPEDPEDQGKREPSLGAVGNDWETFMLTPGVNQIGVQYSDWASTRPKFRVRYREVFL